jgi:hypothetical protein
MPPSTDAHNKNKYQRVVYLLLLFILKDKPTNEYCHFNFF